MFKYKNKEEKKWNPVYIFGKNCARVRPSEVLQGRTCRVYLVFFIDDRAAEKSNHSWKKKGGKSQLHFIKYQRNKIFQIFILSL